MRNCLILGSGRSGTSMVAGTLSDAGYFMGDELTPPRQSNPKGFFEDHHINSINEDLLDPVVPTRPVFWGKERYRYRPLWWQRWLACLSVRTQIACSPEIAARIQSVTRREPYCFKDPRFCYTLNVWRPYLKNVRFVCVFRSPAVTAVSILKECRDAPYLHSLDMTFRQAIRVWTQMYRHVLEIHRFEGDWLFLHYNQLLIEEGLRRLETFLEARVDRTFPELSLRRSFSDEYVPRRTWGVYLQLCELAGYDVT
jgi:hypothetical protein